jgi:cytochrome c oxidase subunit 2
MASKHAPEVELLFWVTMAVTFTVFIITQVVMFYFGYRYRYKKERKAYFYPENHKLEIVWTVIPAIVLVGLIGWGLVKWNNIMGPPPKDAEVIEIMGFKIPRSR